MRRSQDLQSMLAVNIAEVPRRFKFEIYTTDIEHCYEMKRDTLVKLMELTFQAQPQLLQLSQFVFGPQGMQMRQAAPDAWAQALQIYVGAQNTLSEIYKFADFDDVENYLPDVSKYQKLIEMLRAQNAAQVAMLEQMQRGQGGANAQGAIGANGQPVGGGTGPGMAPGGGAPGGGPGSLPAPAGYGGAGPGVGGQ